MLLSAARRAAARRRCARCSCAAAPALAASDQVRLRLPSSRGCRCAATSASRSPPSSLSRRRRRRRDKRLQNMDLQGEFHRFLKKQLEKKTKFEVVETPPDLKLPTQNLTELARAPGVLGVGRQRDRRPRSSCRAASSSRSRTAPGYKTEEYVSPIDGRTYYRQVYVEQTGFLFDIVFLVFDGRTGEKLLQDEFKDFRQTGSRQRRRAAGALREPLLAREPDPQHVRRRATARRSATSSRTEPRRNDHEAMNESSLLASGRRRAAPAPLPPRPRSRHARTTTYFGENKIVYDKFDWQTYRSTHFVDLLLRPGGRSRCRRSPPSPRAPTTTSRAQLNFQIPKPINLIYYATHSEFEQTNTLLNFIPEGVGAFALPTRNRMVLPVDMPDEKLQQLIAHELTHVFQFEILFGGNFLRAVTTRARRSGSSEGMASYFGKDEDAKDQMVLRDAVLADQVPEIAQRGIYGFFAYRFGHAVFDFIAAEWGKDARARLRLRVPRPARPEHRARPEAHVQHLGRGLRHPLPPLPAAAVPEDPRRRRASRSTSASAFKIEDTPSAELSPRAYPSGDFVRGDLDLQARTPTSSSMSTPRPQALQEPDQGLQDRLRVHRRAVGHDGARSAASTSPSPPTATPSPSSRAASAGATCCCLNASTASIRERVEMPDLDQQLNPAFSPDGQHGRLPRRCREGAPTSTPTTSTTKHDRQPDQRRRLRLRARPTRPTGSGSTTPRSRARRRRSSASTRTSRTPASRSPTATGTTRTPSLSPDGKRLFFTSDRDGGIYNIYSINLENGETHPAHQRRRRLLLARPSSSARDSAERLVFSAYYKRRFTLYIDRREEAVPQARRAQPGPVARPDRRRSRPTSRRSRSRSTRRRSCKKPSQSSTSRTRRSSRASRRTRRSSRTRS